MYKLLKKQRLIVTISLIVEFIVILVLSLLVAFVQSYNNYPVIILIFMALFNLYNAVLTFLFNIYIQKKKGQTEISSAEIIGNDIDEAYRFGGIGLVVVDVNNIVMWANDFIIGCFPDIVDKPITDTIPAISYLLNNESSDEKEERKYVLEKVFVDNHFYSVEYLKDARLFIFKDTQDKESLNLDNRKQAPVVGYIAIDNYFDVQMQVSDDAKFNDALASVRNLITTFGSTYKALLRSVKDDRYLFVTTFENYEAMFQAKFNVVDKVRSLMKDGFTLSIGVSYGFPEFAKLTELASSALDVALSRGGDQVVVYPFSNEMIYIGGKTELKPSRNRVKIRTMSNSFLTTIRNYRRILIMGHTNADFDSIGSSLGVYLLCRYAKVEARICYEEQLVESKCRIAINSNYDRKTEFENIFVDFKQASEYLNDETLLVIVDHNNPNISMFPMILEKAQHIAIIDHHRPGQAVIDAQVFNCVDPSASSASEILTSYITYNVEDIFIDKRTATFLLAGITMDTHNFKDKSSIATFEAASQLKSFNADSSKVDDFLKEDYEEYKQKILILNSCEIPYRGVLVAKAPDDEIIASVMLSLVADEAIQIRGIQCSFAYGRVDEHTIKISARSDGTINCGVLMEKLGGGGHFAMAATTFTDLTLTEVKNKLYKVLNDYLDDARSNVKKEED